MQLYSERSSAHDFHTGPRTNEPIEEPKPDPPPAPVEDPVDPDEAGPAEDPENGDFEPKAISPES